MEFNPINLISTAMLVLAFLCAWATRRDLARGATRWFAFGRLAMPLTRQENPVRYWIAMLANIAVTLLFAFVGTFALRAGALRLLVH